MQSSLLRCVVVEVDTNEITLTRRKKAGSSDVESVSDYYSGELVSYVRKVWVLGVAPYDTIT